MSEPNAPPGYTLTDAGLCMPTDLRADATSDLRHPTAWLADWALGGRRVHSGVAVSPQGSMALSAYYACLNVIAQDCAKLPLPVLQELDRGRTKVRTHPLWSILQRQFNADMTAYTGRWTMTHHAVGWGNGYGLILRDRSMTRTDGQVTGIYPLHPSRVWPTRDQDTGAIVYDVRSTGYRDTQNVPSRIPAADMLHLKGPTHDGLVGYSVCEMAAESLGLSLAAQEYGAAFFGNSAMPSGVLMHPATLKTEAQEHLKASWNERHGGPGRSQGTAVLEEGMTWQAITIPPEQAQFLQTRQFQIPEVARWFRMSLHKIADLTNAHYTNIEQQNVEHVTDTMMPWYVSWEQEIARKLLPEETDLYVKHDTRALLRGDSAARAAYFQAMSQIGAYSPNDVLELEEMNPFEGGDEHFLQIQYAPIRKIVDGTARQPRPAPRPAGATDPALAEVAPRNGHHATATQMGS